MKELTLGGKDFATSLALQPDGRIVVAGYTDESGVDSDFAVVRFLADGTPDTSFDGDGIRTIDYSGDDRAAGVAVQPDGRIVVGGTNEYTGTPEFVVSRLTESGATDTSFNGTGNSFANFGGSGDTATSMVLRA